MQLLGDRYWQGKIFSGGWVDGRGHAYASVEPTTMQQLAEVGAATPADVGRAANSAGSGSMKFILKSPSRTPMLIRLPHIGPVETPASTRRGSSSRRLSSDRSLSALPMPIRSVRRSVL